MRRKSNITNGCAAQVFQMCLVHLAVPCFCIAANVSLKEAIGGDVKWDDLFKVDLALSISWLILLVFASFSGRTYNNAASKPLSVSIRTPPSAKTTGPSS